ncbi:unnamed protein product [Urochloa humidicola]
MSSGSAIMLSTAPATAAAGEDEYDNVKCRACYCVVVSSVSLLLFCALAITAGLVQACAVSGFAMVFFGVIGWLVPPADASTRWSDDGITAGSLALRQAEFVIGVPPPFTYECASDAAGEGADGKAGASTLCAVCLEGVRRGDAVRRLPACGQLFHMECVDMWLRSHATCPLCRRELLPRACAAKTSVTAVAVAHVLPPADDEQPDKGGFCPLPWHA